MEEGNGRGLDGKNLRRQCSSKKLLAKSMAKSLNHNQQSEEPGISQAWACLSIPAALKHGQLTAYAKCRCQAYTVLDFRVHQLDMGLPHSMQSVIWEVHCHGHHNSQGRVGRVGLMSRLQTWANRASYLKLQEIVQNTHQRCHIQGVRKLGSLLVLSYSLRINSPALPTFPCIQAKPAPKATESAQEESPSACNRKY